MYKAIENFSDGGTIYNVGDEYPQGKAEKKKIDAFLSDNNGFGKPIIEKVEETVGYDY